MFPLHMRTAWLRDVKRSQELKSDLSDSRAASEDAGWLYLVFCVDGG